MCGNGIVAFDSYILMHEISFTSVLFKLKSEPLFICGSDFDCNGGAFVPKLFHLEEVKGCEPLDGAAIWVCDGC